MWGHQQRKQTPRAEQRATAEPLRLHCVVSHRLLSRVYILTWGRNQHMRVYLRCHGCITVPHCAPVLDKLSHILGVLRRLWALGRQWFLTVTLFKFSPREKSTLNLTACIRSDPDLPKTTLRSLKPDPLPDLEWTFRLSTWVQAGFLTHANCQLVRLLS